MVMRINNRAAGIDINEVFVAKHTTSADNKHTNIQLWYNLKQRAWSDKQRILDVELGWGIQLVESTGCQTPTDISSRW